MTDPVPELAEQIAPDSQAADPTITRVAIVTAVETSGDRRVQLDIADVAWINRLQDTQLSVGDRVSVLQQGPTMLVIGRLVGPDGFTPIGTMLPFAGASTPAGGQWLLCNGSAVSRSTYAGLFAVCGTTYGAGNGTTTFNLPNLVDRLPMGAGSTYGRGSTSSGSVTLSTSNMPSHNHSVSGTADSGGSHGHSLSGSVGSVGDHTHGVGNQSTRSDILAGGGTTTASNGSGSTGSAGGHSHSLSGSADSGGGHTHSLSGTVGSSGSGTSFTPTGPYLALTYIIRAL